MAIYTLPKKFHPDFKNPRIKPVGPVEVDLSDPIARKLKGVIAEGVTVYLDKGAIADIKVTPQGKGLSSNSATGTTGWDFSPSLGVSTESQQTVFLYFNQTTFTGGPSGGDALYCERPSGNQIFKIITDSTGDGDLGWVIRNAAGGGLQERPVVATLDTTRSHHTAMFVKFADDDRKIYADENSASFGGNSGGTYNSADVNICYDQNDTGAANNNATILVAYTFAEALTELEYETLKNDPFRLLKPKTPAIYFTSDSVTPTVSIPVIMNQLRNQGVS